MAWCITNYETSEVMAMFLESIRARSPSSTVTVLMTDDGMSVHVHGQARLPALHSTLLFSVSSFTCFIC